MVTLPANFGEPNPPNYPSSYILRCLWYLRSGWRYKSQPMKGAWSRLTTIAIDGCQLDLHSFM